METFLLANVSEDDWNNHYKDTLTTTLEDKERLEEQAERWGEPDKEGRGEFVLTRHEEVAPVPTNFNFKPAKPPT